MSWFSKPEPDPKEETADAIWSLRRTAKQDELAGRFLGHFANSQEAAGKYARNAERQQQQADELQGDGRVRGWW